MAESVIAVAPLISSAWLRLICVNLSAALHPSLNLLTRAALEADGNAALLACYINLRINRQTLKG